MKKLEADKIPNCLLPFSFQSCVFPSLLQRSTD